jgi:hypothetical protein
MNKDKALRLAWDALQQIAHVSAMDYEYQQWAVEAITAIKKALAQPEQDGECKYCTDGCPACDARKLPEQEPVAWRAWVSKFPQGTGSDWVYVTKPIMKDSVHNQPLYTTPPQRTWVGLTDEEVKNFVQAVWPREATPTDYIRAIEAKLKEKNVQR